jgi:hypothetical protein
MRFSLCWVHGPNVRVPPLLFIACRCSSLSVCECGNAELQYGIVDIKKGHEYISWPRFRACARPQMLSHTYCVSLTHTDTYTRMCHVFCSIFCRIFPKTCMTANAREANTRRHTNSTSSFQNKIPHFFKQAFLWYTSKIRHFKRP